MNPLKNRRKLRQEVNSAPKQRVASCPPPMVDAKGNSGEGSDRKEQEDLYRQCLVDLSTQTITTFGKTVITLSGGGLAVSLTMLKDVFGNRPLNGSEWLLAAWSCWGGSLFCILACYYTSHLAMRSALKMWDTEKKVDTSEWWNRITQILNPTSGLLFLAGLSFLLYFISHNPFDLNGNAEASTSATAETSATATSTTGHKDERSSAAASTPSKTIAE